MQLCSVQALHRFSAKSNQNPARQLRSVPKTPNPGLGLGERRGCSSTSACRLQVVSFNGQSSGPLTRESSKIEPPLGPRILAGPPLANSITPPRRRSEEESMTGSCAIAEVSADNDSDPDHTVVAITIKNFPGLLRMIAWVMTGLEMTVARAILRTDESSGEDVACNRYYITYQGAKLDAGETARLVERLEDFVTYCAPAEDVFGATVFEQGPVKVDNDSDPSCTVLTFSYTECVRNTILEVASTITGLGVSIVEADIQTTDPCVERPDPWLFRLQSSDGKKLDYIQISGLMYTLMSLEAKSRQLRHNIAA